MKTKRKEYIEILRTIAILYVVIYHIYAITNITFKSNILNTLISLGGDIGVSIFFVISGFGIYSYLNKNPKINFIDYIKNRIKKIAPNYYLSILVMLLFSSSAIYIGKDYILNLLSHLFFFHNIFYSYHGAISGVLWTMGVIFQFYLVAPFLKKIMDKKPKLTLIASIMLTILLKAIVFYILKINKVDNMYYFIYGRQLFTSLDAFVLGMFVANKSNYENNKIKDYIGIIMSIIFIITLICIGSPFSSLYHDIGIHSPTIKGLLFFICLDISIAYLMFCISSIKYKKNKVADFLLGLSKYEYPIYIWHLLILNSIVNYSSLYINLKNYNCIVVYMVLTFLSLFLSVMIGLIIENINFQMIFDKIKTMYILNKKIIITSLYIILLLMVLFKVKNNLLIANAQKLNDEASLIYSNVKNKMKCDKEQCVYMYIDYEKTGYFNFYELRYYLSPNISIHYNDYVSVIVNGTENDLYKYIKESDADYLIVKDNIILKENGYRIDSLNGTLFKVNKKSNNIKNLLEEVKQ